MNPVAKVLLITVNYKSAVSTVEFLSSLRCTHGFSEIEVVILDNSPREEHLPSLRQAIAQLQNVELLESSTNRGYFGGARFALEHYLASGHCLPDWVIVCNHDVLIEDRDFFLRLLAHNPLDVGMIAPRIRTSPANVDQNPFMRRRPGFWRRASMRFYSHNYRLGVIWDWFSRQKLSLLSILKIAKTGAVADGQTPGVTIYAGHGAFLIFSRRYFESGGYLDSNLFLYGEEIASAEICSALGLRVLYDPALQVIHREHASTGKRMDRRSYEDHRRAVEYLMSRYLAR